MLSFFVNFSCYISIFCAIAAFRWGATKEPKYLDELILFVFVSPFLLMCYASTAFTVIHEIVLIDRGLAIIGVLHYWMYRVLPLSRTSSKYGQQA